MSRIYRLDCRVLRLSGNAAHFLEGLSSNTTDAPTNAFLNQHARIVATFVQKQVDDETFLLLVACDAYEGLMQHIQKYLMLNQTQCAVVDGFTYADVDDLLTLAEGDMSFGAPVGRIVLTEKDMDNTLSDDEFTLLRLDHGWPLHKVDYDDQMILNVGEHFVSFTKGCFLGQEPVSKVHNRSKPSRQLTSVFLDELSEDDRSKATSVVLDPASQRERGFFFLKNND